MSSHNITTRGGGIITASGLGPEKPDNQFDAELAQEMIKRTAKVNDTTLDLAERLKEARLFIAWSASHLKGSWLDWQEQCGKAIHDLNLDRMAFDRESKTIIAAGKDVRDFFNSTEYQQAHGRLKELVVLLDRFGELKKDGTLDAFADFILKVQK